MRLLRAVRKLMLVSLAAFCGAAAADLARQRLTGETGQVITHTPSGDWSVHAPPRLLIPAILAGFRADERGLLRAFGTAAILAGTKGESLGGIASRFFGKPPPAS